MTSVRVSIPSMGLCGMAGRGGGGGGVRVLRCILLLPAVLVGLCGKWMNRLQ
jgi:hypothetical protein